MEDRRTEAESRRKHLLANQTPTERRFRRIMASLGICSYPQVLFWLDSQHYRIVDFYLPKPYRICIELDGQSHEGADNESYDRWKDKKLLMGHRSFRIVRFNNSEVYKPDFKDKLLLSLRRYRVRPHHKRRRWLKSKRFHFKRLPQRDYKDREMVKDRDHKPMINLGMSIVYKSLKAERKKNQWGGCNVSYSPGYSLAEMKTNGWL